MQQLLLFLIGGSGFWLGWAMLLLGPALGIPNRRLWRLVAAIGILLGTAIVFVSTTPLPIFANALWILALAGWAISECLRRPTQRARRWVRCIAVAAGLAIGAIEARYHLRPVFPRQSHHRVYVIGDSISAGLGHSNITIWPDILRRDHAIEVVNLSRAGANLSVALRGIQSTQFADGIVLIEIGGNDLISNPPTPPADFEARLDQLLDRATASGSALAMFELPLLPGQMVYGRIQRSLAQRHRVILIPRRYLVSVLATTGATLDGIHLSAEGHKRMAAMVWELTGSSLR